MTGRERVIAYLAEAGVGSTVYVDKVLQEMTRYRSYDRRPSSYPEHEPGCCLICDALHLLDAEDLAASASA